MPRNAGTGIYAAAASTFNPAVAGTIISPTDWATLLADITDALNTATPILGTAGSVVGTIGFNNATSGRITLSPPTGALGTVTLTLPAATDTLVGKATTDVLTNKTYDTAGTGNVFKVNGTTLTSLGATLTISGAALQSVAFTGDVTTAANSFATTIAANVVNFSKVQQVGAVSLIGNSTGLTANLQGITLGATLAFSGTVLQTAALTGDVTASANSFATTIAANVVTNAKAAQMAANTFKGNNTAGTANASDLTIAQTVTALAASEATAEAGTSTATLNTPQGTAQAIVALDQKFKNIVGRNGGCEVWQRLTTGTTIAVAASTVAYTLDGWYLATAANQASTLTQVAGLTSGSRFGAQVQRNSGQTGTGAMVFAFPLDTDELVKLRGNAAVLSFTVATGANWSPTSGTLTWKLYCGTGAVAKRNATGYTGETNPISGSVNLATGASAARQVSAISSAIGATITQAELQFTWTPTGTAGVNDWFSIDDVQVEVVPTGIAAVVPLFERSDFVWDLARCQRFLPVFKNSGGALVPYGIAQVNSTSSAAVMVPFHVPVRAAPTALVISAAADFQLTNSVGSGTVLNALTFVGAGLDSGWIQGGVATTPFVAGNASQFFGTATTASFIFTGAEI